MPKTKEDTRLWLDKQQGQEVFSIFPDQRFYSVEYPGEDTDKIVAFLEKKLEFDAWCRDAFHAVQQGAEIPPLPAFLLEEVKVAPTRKRKSQDSQS